MLETKKSKTKIQLHKEPHVAAVGSMCRCKHVDLFVKGTERQTDLHVSSAPPIILCDPAKSVSLSPSQCCSQRPLQFQLEGKVQLLSAAAEVLENPFPMSTSESAPACGCEIVAYNYGISCEGLQRGLLLMRQLLECP